MIEPVNWQDHIVEHPDWYKEVDVGNGNVQHVKVPGAVKQQGTPLNGKNLNRMESEGLEGIFLGLINTQYINQLSQKVSGIEETKIDVVLKNSQAYPFNNSKKTVSLPFNRNTKDYTVDVEVTGKKGAGAGEILISEKLLNGFKVEYTGAATEVDITCTIRGGI